MDKHVQLTINANQKVKELGDLYGIFFEDLNHAADGGLYAEMVQNRSFEYDATDNPTYHALTAWQRIQRGSSMVKLHVESSEPLHPNNPHYLVLDVNRAGMGGVQNSGYYKGMWVRQDHRYRFSCWYRLRSRKPVTVLVRLESADETQCYAEERIVADSHDWARATCTLTATATDTTARLVVAVEEPVSLALDMVSLFPEATFRGRENGLRADLAQMLADLKPKFMRFPGGCLVHCGSLNPNDRESMYRWKHTLGPVEQRTTWRNIWQYNQSLGLGYYEYFLLCEDIGAQPLPVIPGGWDPHTWRGADKEDMQEWIDEALDLIEFANGSAETVWGRRRCELGHPEPFHLKYLAIGNEEVGEEFFERYEIIHRAVKEKYPDIRLISSGGPGCAGSVFDRGWAQARELGASYVDEHFYQSPDWFVANAHRYESYPAQGTQAFLGEYASHGDTWWNALAEAAFMVGMEKAPGLGLACYAPLFCHVDDAKWKPDMICFNQHQVYGTPSYHVQKLMMNHQGDQEVVVEQTAPATMKPPVKLTGEIAFVAQNNDVSVADVVVTNLDTGETVMADDFRLGGESQERLIAKIDWENYRISFRAVRHSECDEAHHVGGRPFALEFARKDEKNKLRWHIDGWMSLTSISHYAGEDFCDLVLNEFPHEKERWYSYALEVLGDELVMVIDDKRFPATRACQPVIEPLYSCASVEEATGDLIVKVTNLQTAVVETELQLNGFDPAKVEIYQMSGFKHTDRNSLDEPEKVVPNTITAHAEAVMRWFFPPESLTILRFHPRKES